MDYKHRIAAFVAATAEQTQLQTAYSMAAAAHAEQKRKYTGEDYIVHPVSVASQVIAFLENTVPMEASTVEKIAIAAILHDTVEDTDTTFSDIERCFGADVMNIVFWLTDDIPHRQGNRHIRAQLAAEKLGNAPWEAKLIKAFDIIDNCNSIVDHDAKFAATYLPEKLHALRKMEAGTELTPAHGVLRAAIAALTEIISTLTKE